MKLNEIKKFDLSIISDPHLLDESLIGQSSSLEKELKLEKKLIVESESLFKRALDLVDEAGSDFLILPGDMTKEGELASHKKASLYLKKWKDENPKRKIFLVPGNHDINSKRAYDYKNDKKLPMVSPAEFEKSYDFIYKDDSILEFYRDSEIFKSYLAEVNEKFNRDKKYSYYANGYFTYVARIKKENIHDNGLTIIMIDSCIYSADCEQGNRDATSNIVGSVNKNQIKWIVEKIDQAKARKDMIIAVAHHAFIPIFRNQQLVFSPFIIKEYKSKIKDSDPRINNKTPIEALADNGVKFIFTGHLHENGTARFITEKDHEIYDIQTGSTITYPLPIRHIKIDNKIGQIHGFEIYIKTELIRDFTYKDEFGRDVRIDDAILHTLQNQLSLKEVIYNAIRIQANNPKLIKLNLKKELFDQINANTKINLPYENYVNDVIFPMIEDRFPMKKTFIGNVDLEKKASSYQIVVKAIGNKIIIKAENIEDTIDLFLKQIERDIFYPELMIYFIEKLSNKIFKMPIDNKGHTFYDFANFIYQYKADTDDRPEYIDTMIHKLKDKSYNIIDETIDFAGDEINEIFDYVTSNVKFIKYGSKNRFYDDLIQTQGITSNLTYKYIRHKVNNLRDLLNFFSRPITNRSKISGVDFAKTIAHSKTVTKLKINFFDKMFGQKSIRKFITEMLGELNADVAKIYQNDGENDVNYYFNYIEYDDSEAKFQK